jgi:hypothetical protein
MVIENNLPRLGYLLSSPNLVPKTEWKFNLNAGKRKSGHNGPPHRDQESTS